MKIFRFRWGVSYGYIRANWFERRAIRKRIAAGDTGIYESRAIGPKNYGAQFIISAKRNRAPAG